MTTREKPEFIKVFSSSERERGLAEGQRLQRTGHAVNIALTYDSAGGFESLVLTHYLTCAACSVAAAERS